MAKNTKNTFNPDYAVHPGEILAETLEARRMKKREFADRCGISAKTVSQILGGKQLIDPATAIHFSRVLDVSANIWNSLSATYRLHAAKKEDVRAILKKRTWIRKFPVSEMVKRGYIDNPANDLDTAQKLLGFLGVGNIEAWEERVFLNLEADYRYSLSFRSDPYAVAVWLRIGDIAAEKTECKSYNEAKFLHALHEIRTLTLQSAEVFTKKMRILLAAAGTVIIFVPEFKNTRLSGAAKWISKDKALIMMSLRNKTDDHFWFTFYHEAAHILKHGRKNVFLDDPDSGKNDKEKEADRFASDFLIPNDAYKNFLGCGDFTGASIKRFASLLGIAPGIILGRLQHDRHVDFRTRLNRLKRQFTFNGN